jgi:chromosome segregation ATPase
MKKFLTASAVEMSSGSEVDGDSFGDLDSAPSVGESNASSHSSNFVSMWPTTQTQTHQILQDVSLETKKYQLDRHAIELDASVLDREIELQGEIREINAEISELQLEIANNEAILSQIKESRNSNILEIRKRLIVQLRKYDSILAGTDETIAQLTDAIAAQRLDHEERKAHLLQAGKDDEAELELGIQRLTDEIDSVRKETHESIQKGESDMIDTRAMVELLENELSAVSSDSTSVEGQFVQLNRDLTKLKRELIIAEEVSENLRSQIEQNKELRAQMRGVIDRTKQQNWQIQSRLFNVLE